MRLIEEPYQAVTRGVKNPISSDKVVEWLVSNRILSIALGGGSTVCVYDLHPPHFHFISSTSSPPPHLLHLICSTSSLHLILIPSSPPPYLLILFLVPSSPHLLHLISSSSSDPLITVIQLCHFFAHSHPLTHPHSLTLILTHLHSLSLHPHSLTLTHSASITPHPHPHSLTLTHSPSLTHPHSLTLHPHSSITFTNQSVLLNVLCFVDRKPPPDTVL